MKVVMSVAVIVLISVDMKVVMSVDIKVFMREVVTSVVPVGLSKTPICPLSMQL